jgi:hypothetical protein
MHHKAVLTADKAIRLTPATSLLKLEVGDPIKLDERAFALVAGAFFAELERRYL